MDRTAPYKLPAATSINSGFGTRPNLNLWIEVNDNTSKETVGRKKKCGREMEKDTGGNEWEKGIRAKVVWRKACEEIPTCLKGRRRRLAKLV